VRGYSAAKASPVAMNRKKSNFFIRYFLLLKLVCGTDDTWRLPYDSGTACSDERKRRGIRTLTFPRHAFDKK
jgi:hypothetical protein